MGIMGRIKSNQIKKNSYSLLSEKKNIIKKNFDRCKVIADYFMKIQSKKLRNKFAGSLIKYQKKIILKKNTKKKYKFDKKKTNYNSNTFKYENNIRVYYKYYLTI